MATVYLADEEQYPRKVAIKVFNPEVGGTASVDRFLRETRITAGFRHINILPVLDSGRVGDVPFYVMPHVTGGTLKDRLAREGPLPLDDVVRLTREIADGIAFAHSHQVIHRDIKPGNILLEEGHALVADFGIVRPVVRDPDDVPTTEGVILGTPTYMSPEQASGAETLDARSDVYSLACVAYEMLAGEAPFTGPSPHVIIAKKNSLPPPPLATYRDRLPPGLDEVLQRALARSPADRFESATTFADALTAAAGGNGPARGRSRTAWLIAAFVVVVGALAWLGSRIGGAGARAMAPDTTAYVVFAFDGSDASPGLDETQYLRDAIARWSDLRAVPSIQLRDALGNRDARSLTQAQAAAVARDVGAGRFIRGTVSRVGDALRVNAVLFDAANTGTRLADVTVRLPDPDPDPDSIFAVIADDLLFRGRLDSPGGSPRGTTSFGARVAWIRGEEALRVWDLATADSSFAAAAVADPGFAGANLMVALTRLWQRLPPSTWQVAAHQASLPGGALSPVEQRVARAVAAHADGDLATACDLWRDLAQDEATDYRPWYSLALCLTSDAAVIRDRRGEWRFRTSYHEAIRAYQTAFRLHPPILGSFRAQTFLPLRQILRVGGNARRDGLAPAPDSLRFAADPAWRGDTLAYMPQPLATAADRLTAPAAEVRLALLRMRQTFRDIAAAWVAVLPASADARQALGLSLALLGDPSALDTLRSARALATDPAERLAGMALETWIQLAGALPRDTAGLLRARALADSIVQQSTAANAEDPAVLAGLAALTGRAFRAAAIQSSPRAAARRVDPPPLRAIGPALLTYSAMGGPADSIRTLERSVWTTIRDDVDPGERNVALAQWIILPAGLAYATRSSAYADSLAGWDWLLDAQRALSKGDDDAVRDALADVRRQRAGIDPGRLTWDALFPEAWLLSRLGDDDDAATWLDPAFDALPGSDPLTLAQPERTASLVRAMALRAGIAQRTGDAAGARTWARAVTILWGDADPFLQPVVAAMRTLATQAGPSSPPPTRARRLE